MTFCTVILYTTKVILRSGPILKVALVTSVAILNVAVSETYYGCRVAFYPINYINISSSSYHSIMLNNIRRANNYQDDRTIQNGHQIEDYSHI